MFGYDNNGNIYFIKLDEYYRIDIDKNDLIELIKLNNINNISSKKIEYKKINKQNMLHIKSIENALCELEDMTDDDLDEKENFSDIYEQSEDYKYNPEKRYFHSENNEYDSDDMQNDRNIILYENVNDKISKLDLENDIPSFETLIINGNTKSNDLIFRTEIINDQPLYRITIFTDFSQNTAQIILNIIGTKFIKFNLKYDTLELVKQE
jgi:hypothetical protein